MSLFTELKRRNVFRVALAYVVVAWLLMQVGDTLAPALLLPEWTLRFLAFVLLLGFPLALFAAWAVQLTPDGIKLEKSTPRSEPDPPPARRKLDALIIVLLAVAVSYFAWDKFAAHDDDSAEAPIAATSPATDRRSIVVLPFLNMSGDAEQEYFSDGLSEELLNLLAKIPELRVTSRSSAFYFKGKDYTIADVGEQLGVSHVLEGSVRRSGDQVRITAQLIDVSTDSHLWSDTWDRAFEDIFAVQDEIAEAVTTALKIQLVDELPHTFVTDPRAYDLFLKARELIKAQSEASMVEAESLLLEVLQIDPDYPPGLIALGELELFLGMWAFRPMGASFERAQEFGQRAVAAAPTLSDGYTLLARLAIRKDRDFSKGRRLIDDVIRRDPANIKARAIAGWFDAMQGQHEERIRLARETVRLDPLSAEAYWGLGHALMNAREYDEAVAAFRKLLEVAPDATAGHAALAETLFLAGNYDEALVEFNKEPQKGFMYFGRAMAYFMLGEQEQSDAALDALLGLENADGWAAQIAMVHAVRGENDDAFKWIDRAIELNDQGIISAKLFPFFDNLRSDPRFDEFMQRIWSGEKEP